MERERGFTLVETMVTVGIFAVLLVAGGFWLLGMHPGALAQATDDYDAAMAGARALAMTSLNGATVVFAPRSSGGFALRVYAGRPSAVNSVQPTTAMPVESDATISEKSLGAPPFAIFVAASGHVSGKASYPAIDASGNAAFAPITVEPVCPAGGFVLTFRGPQGATATRTLPCTTIASIASPGPPNPSPTANVPIVTPPQMVYHWPADAQQRFVATEWGYTHWFATTNGFACGKGIATFPDVLPSPYSAAYSQAEADATPSPPAGTPYSYPNSGGASMNDAPAAFPLDPAVEGLCNAVVTDDYGQRAHAAVQVMGWLTATYKGKEYTHLTAPELSLPSSDLASKGSTVTLAISKTYDSEPLQPAVELDSACSPYVAVAISGGSTPGTPSPSPATATVTLTLVTAPGSKISCGGTIYDQYPRSKRGEGISFNAAIAPPEVSTWPPVVQYPLQGFPIAGAGGNICAVNQPRALDATGAAALTSAVPPPGFPVNWRTDGSGCLEHYNGSWIKVDQTATSADGVSALIYEQGYSGGFFISGPNTTAAKFDVPCNPAVFNSSPWSNTGPSAGVIGAAGGTTGTCGLGATSGNDVTVRPSNTVGVEVAERNCATGIGENIYVTPGSSCTIALPANAGTEPCVSGGESGPFASLRTYYASFTPSTGEGDRAPVPNGGTQSGASISSADGSGSYLFTAPARGGGPWTVNVIQHVITAHNTVVGCAQDDFYNPDFAQIISSS